MKGHRKDHPKGHPEGHPMPGQQVAGQQDIRRLLFTQPRTQNTTTPGESTRAELEALAAKVDALLERAAAGDLEAARRLGQPDLAKAARIRRCGDWLTSGRIRMVHS